MHRRIVWVIAGWIGLSLSWLYSQPTPQRQALPLVTPAPSPTMDLSPHPELVLTAPAYVYVGEAFTLTVDYLNIGAPSTGFSLTPANLVTYDPPLTLPCVFSQHPTDCRSIGYRGEAHGRVVINAGASGEIMRDGFFVMGYAAARNPITVSIIDLTGEYKLFAPMMLPD